MVSNSGFNELNVEEVSWDAIRETVLSKNPDLAKAIDPLNTKKMPFYKARYRYGCEIVDKGTFYLPCKNGRLVSINDKTVPDTLRNKVNYSSIPLCLVLSRSNEVYVETSERVIPLNYFLPGDLFGVFESMNFMTGNNSQTALWSVSSGARSTFLLPRISDTIGHNKMRKKLGLVAKAPTSLFEHQKVFTQIVSRYNQDTAEDALWENEILILPKDLFSSTKSDTLELYKFMISICWQQSQLFQDSIEFNLRWSSFSEELGNRNLKPRVHIVAMVKFLYSIGAGSNLAFIPNSNLDALPADIIERVYTEIYGLKHYFPTIMVPCKFNSKTSPVYSSLALPTVLESSPYVKNQPSIMEDTREIRKLLRISAQSMIRNNPHLQKNGTDLIYDFFHPEEDTLNEVRRSADIVKEDSRFALLSSQYKDRVPCDNAPFFRGCIRIQEG